MANGKRLDTVSIRNCTYEAGRGSKKKLILNKINLTVAEASIYGLLGPSGCGKTTMLRCVVGRIKPKNGHVLVFGLRPGDDLGHVPGKHVGYMPQEISIYEDFTIQETLSYFGRINRMHEIDIDARIEFLLKFLDLPFRDRLVANLSGGQKRRVSLAAALVHSPPLLILDEPTVGVDPLLRQSIWRHLVAMTKNERISVIITTHYIEEARQANVVGLMRHGKILAEDSPEALMEAHGQSNLEDVFLKLCMSETSRRAASLARKTLHASDELPKRSTESKSPHPKERKSPEFGAHKSSVTINTATNSIIMNQNRTTSSNGYYNEAIEVFESEDEDDYDLTNQQDQGVETTLTSTVNYGTKMTTDQYLASQMLGWAARRSNQLSVASMQLTKEHYHLGARDTRKSRGYYNDRKDAGFSQWAKTLTAVTWKNYLRLRRNPPVLIFQFVLPAIQVILFCLCIGGEPFDVPVAIVNDEQVPKSSLQFLNGLNKQIIRQLHYDNLTSAIEAVRRGQVWGVIHIPNKYSENLQSRLILGEEVSSETISNGTIKVHPDLTNLHLALTLETALRGSFMDFARNSLKEMGYDPSLADMPIQMSSPIYGSATKDGYLEFMAPGVIISISYVMATGLTSLAFILERRDGLLERSIVSGVQTNQILLAHAINQIVVMVAQIFLVLGCTFFIFEIPSRGPFGWVVLLILLQGCTGMAFGLLVSAICKEENTAVMMVVGTFYTNLILAGIIWPIEAMPYWLRPISYAQPQTLPTETLRHILSRGWGIGESGVLLGFGVTFGWLAIFLLSAGCIFKYSS